MNLTNIERRLNQFKTREWKPKQFKDWYGIDFNKPKTIKLLAQAAIFAGTNENQSLFTEANLNFADEDKIYDHWHLEIFLQRRDLIPINVAASRLALTPDSFREITTKLSEEGHFLHLGDPWPSDDIIHKRLLQDFHKGFPKMLRRTFSNHSNYITRLHTNIRDLYHIKFDTLRDCSDQALDKATQSTGYYTDFLTKKPIGLDRTVFIETGKPIQLEPDVCSWLTYVKNLSLLEDIALSPPHPRNQHLIDELIDADV
jgi:hypothetical protein